MQNDECGSTDFDELSRIELAEVRMQNSVQLRRNQKKIHHGDTEGTEKKRRRRSIPFHRKEGHKKTISRPFFSVLSVSPW